MLNKHRSIMSKSRIYTVIKITASELAAEVNGVLKKKLASLAWTIERERKRKREAVPVPSR